MFEAVPDPPTHTQRAKKDDDLIEEDDDDFPADFHANNHSNVHSNGNMSDTHGPVSASESWSQWAQRHTGLLTLLNLALFLSTVVMILYALSATPHAVLENIHSSSRHNNASAKTVNETDPHTHAHTVPLSLPLSEFDRDPLPPCEDPEWCDIPMPSTSLFRFAPPTDSRRWRIAQIRASRGDLVLLEEAVKAFPSHFDFLDGDISFRRLHLAMDLFLDERRDLSPLTYAGRGATRTAGSDAMGDRRRLTLRTEAHTRANTHTEGEEDREAEEQEEEEEEIEENGQDEEDEELFPLVNRDTDAQTSTLTHTDTDAHRRLQRRRAAKGKQAPFYPWEKEGRRVVPDPYDVHTANRAAVVAVGYTAYARDSQTYFSGNRIGGAFLDRRQFFNHWKKAKDDLAVPLVAICSLNENWGFLSTKFPNRTAGWGQCCSAPKDNVLYEFLDHEKTLMLATNQHTNVSHPKLLILPRGLPLTWGQTRILVWDTQRNALAQGKKKTKLLFAAASKWGPRPQILACISSKFSGEEFDGHIANGPQTRLARDQYYYKLAQARFGVGLPGLGYDTFRAWELMTMGSIVVLEKNVGFDRSMWRLPALFVEDFAEVTPALLRTAYVEALYRAKDFEFERLTQSFWFNVIANVSASKSTQPLLDAFPYDAEDHNFTRPRIPYECGRTGTCGEGTKRIPKVSC